MVYESKIPLKVVVQCRLRGRRLTSHTSSPSETPESRSRMLPHKRHKADSNPNTMVHRDKILKSSVKKRWRQESIGRKSILASVLHKREGNVYTRRKRQRSKGRHGPLTEVGQHGESANIQLWKGEVSRGLPVRRQCSCERIKTFFHTFWWAYFGTSDSTKKHKNAREKALKKSRKAAKKLEREKRELPLIIGNLQYFKPFVRGSHRNHFVEIDRPVAAGKVEVLFSSSRLIVVSKPAPMPVNRNAHYYRANLRHILKQQLSISGRLSAIHRLDICTTGVVLLSTDKNATNDFALKFRDRKVTKVYLALTEGSFPWPQDGKPLICSELVDGKPSVTRFYRLRMSEGDYISSSGKSMVLAIPLSGRRHQIRKHLSFLGFPIVGDSLYGSVSELASHFPSSQKKSKRPYLDGAERAKLDGMFSEALGHFSKMKKADKGICLGKLRAHLGTFEQRPWCNTRVCLTPIALHAWIIAGCGSVIDSEDSNTPWCFRAPKPKWANFLLGDAPNEIHHLIAD